MTGPSVGGTAPEVSIVICTRNRAATLGGTLRSLARLDGVRSWDVLLVDNGSTDETPSVLAAADDCGGRLSVIRFATPGLGAARDAGWRSTRGRIVAFTDDDCYPEPDFVDALAGAFDENPDAGCIGGRILLYDPDDARVTIDERDEASLQEPYRFVEPGIVQGANMAFRRATLQQIDGFDRQLGAGTSFACEDIDAAAAALWSGIPVRFDPSPVVWHHHRRRDRDLDTLWRSYDRGRGAYYAKYLLRRDTRSAYAAGWWRILRTYRERWQLIRLAREVGGALGYLAARRAGLAAIVMAPVGALALALVSFIVAVRLVWWRVRPLDRRVLSSTDRGVGHGADPGQIGGDGVGREQGARHLAPDLSRVDRVGGEQPSPDTFAIPARARRFDTDGTVLSTDRGRAERS